MLKQVLIFKDNFRTGGAWDLKNKPGLPLPGTWAMYKGEIVSDAYLANNAYGQALAKAGYSLVEALTIADGYSVISRNGQHDQPEDQAAIVSGWYEYHKGDPWPDGLLTPTDYEIIKSKYPEIYSKLSKPNWATNYNPLDERFILRRNSNPYYIGNKKLIEKLQSNVQ